MNQKAKNALLAKSSQAAWRLHVLLVLTIFAFAVLSFRLWTIQVFQHDIYSDKAKINYVREIPIPSQRGEILDRNGVRLAYDVPYYDIWVPILINKSGKRVVTPEMETTLRILAEYLKRSTETTEEQFEWLKKEYLTSQRDIHYKHDRVRLAKGVQFSKYAPIRERQNIEFPEEARVFIEKVQKRLYPKQDFAAHVLGYTAEVSLEQLQSPSYADYSQGDLVGKAGIEKQYESFLRGKEGVKQVKVDRFEIQRGDAIDLQKATQGFNIVLNLDYKMQRIAEQVLGASRGVIIVSDPRDNSIIAMVSNPRYNPNNVSRDLPMYNMDSSRPMFHRAAMGRYEPGSVIKIFEAFALMEELGYTTAHKESCGGEYWLGGSDFIHCDKREGHGWLDFTGAIRLSCNIYFFKTVKELGYNRLLYWMSQFGFNAKTGVDLPIENYTPYPKPRYPADLVMLAIGQSGLLLNPLQIHTAVCAIANGGKFYAPRIAKKIISPESLNPDAKPVQEFLPVEKSAPIEAAPETWEAVRHAMWEVVNNWGTGRRVKNKDFVLAGKTGTAQNSGPDTHAWFTCYGPYENPTIAITVLLEHSGHGGEIASPLVVPILDEYLSSPTIAQVNAEK